MRCSLSTRRLHANHVLQAVVEEYYRCALNHFGQERHHLRDLTDMNGATRACFFVKSRAKKNNDEISDNGRQHIASVINEPWLAVGFFGKWVA